MTVRYGSEATCRLSIWYTDGAVIAYEANSLEKIKRLPMNKSSGKYNAYNKTRYLEGTNH